MDLIAPHPVFNLYNDRWPVYTYRGAQPPAKVSRGPGGEPAHVYGSLLCEGSIISGAHVERSILGPGVYVDHDAHVTDSILFPDVRVGPGARLHRCIVDKNVDDPVGLPHRPRQRRGRRTLHHERRGHRRHREGQEPLVPVVVNDDGRSRWQHGTPLAELVVSDDEREIWNVGSTTDTAQRCAALSHRAACAEAVERGVADRLGVSR